MYKQYFQPSNHFCNHWDDKALSWAAARLILVAENQWTLSFTRRWKCSISTGPVPLEIKHKSVLLKDITASSDKQRNCHCDLSPPVSGARTAPATGPPTPGTGHPAAGRWRRGRRRGGWAATLFPLLPAPTVILAIGRAPAHAGWHTAGITHTREGLLMSKLSENL